MTRIREEEASPIRLTNRTSNALRKGALKVRRASLILRIFLTAGCAGLAVYYGIEHLLAVPAFVLLALVLDLLIGLHSERIALSMTAQAICTEKAVRDMRDEQKKQERLRERDEVRRSVLMEIVSEKTEDTARENHPAEEPHRRRRARA